MSGKHITGGDELKTLLEGLKRVAVLGIRSQLCQQLPTYYVPEYMASRGIEIIPVPVYEPKVTHILNQPVIRDLKAIPGTVDLVNVFRRPTDIDAHVPDLLALKPAAVWFQQGIRNDAAAAKLTAAGIDVVQDRCLMVDYRNLVP